jgi:hypothetical protein
VAGELADVPRFAVLKTQICVTRPQCVKIKVIIRPPSLFTEIGFIAKTAFYFPSEETYLGIQLLSLADCSDDEF